jgi:hypothetical protein
VHPMLAVRFFAIHSFGPQIERIVFNDLLSLSRRNLMARNVTEVGIIPFKSRFAIQLIL